MNAGVSLHHTRFLVLLSVVLTCLKKDASVSLHRDMEPYIVYQGLSPMGSGEPQLPSLAPSAVSPFASSVAPPRLSGSCVLNFSDAEGLMKTTSTNCISMFAPYLADVICCPQLEASLVILMGEYGRRSGRLALNGSGAAAECLSDMNLILESQGASADLQSLCSVHPFSMTAGRCPISTVREFERRVDTSELLKACEHVNLLKECCEKTCENAVSRAAEKLLLSGKRSANECRAVVLRWVASRLSTPTAKELLRGLSSCGVNRVCPLDLPDTGHVVLACGSEMHNQTLCCTAIQSYMSRIQKQKFVTNMQALNCAASLVRLLQMRNMTRDVYGACHLTLKDFSLQAATQSVLGFESGCLLPSLPLDLVFDASLRVSFLCDLNDNIAAPWDSHPLSSCNNQTSQQLPQLPAPENGGRASFAPHIVWTLAVLPYLFFT